jgi:hypothetical protein
MSTTRGSETSKAPGRYPFCENLVNVDPTTRKQEATSAQFREKMPSRREEGQSKSA